MSTSNRKTTWIAILSAAALSTAYVVLMFLPQQRVIRERAGQLQAKQNYVVASGNVAAAIHATRGELERAESYNAAYSDATPPEGELADVLGRIDALVVTSGVTPTRFDPEPAVKMEKLRRVPVVVGCSGTFAQLSQLLCGIESLPQLVWIDRIQIEKSREDGGAVECEIDLSVFADNPDESDQVNIAGWPIKEETGFQRRLSASVRPTRL